ncbi:Panacea domain-containing protein [Enterococcus devriesei]|uniref:Panacea domain-containing protein n=1 Tax=Enterococcus devriesei TaxID=319970 RepID=UPI0036D2769F
MFSAMDIADFILQNRIDAREPISNLELQKYLYFVNARFLFEKNEPLFEEPLEKWKFGPVVSDVYHEYKNSQANKITELSRHESVEITDEGIKFNTNEFDTTSIPLDVQRILNESIERLSKFDPFELVEETHKHTEWKNDEARIMNGEQHLVYDSELMKNYFIEHEEARIW